MGTEKHLHENASVDTFGHEVLQTSERCLREVQLFGNAAIKGAIEDGTRRVKHDPKGVLTECAYAAGSGLVIACAVDAIPAAVAVIGTVAAADYVARLIDPRAHGTRNHDIGEAWNWAWSGTQRSKENYYEQKISREIGNDVFDFGLCTAMGSAGYRVGARAFSAPRPDLVESATHPHLNKPDGEALSTTQLRHFLAGDRNAFVKGRLKLTPHRTLRYENSVHAPRENSKLSDYTAVKSSIQ